MGDIAGRPSCFAGLNPYTDLTLASSQLPTCSRQHRGYPQFTANLGRAERTTREYLIHMGSFIGGGGSSEASADQAANHLACSPHWSYRGLAMNPERN
jgi:hypothetical protein